MLKCFFGIVVIQGTYLATLQFPEVRGLALVQVILCTGLILPLVHVVRWYMREKHAAIWQLKHFDLAKVECQNDFDRRFVHGAIRDWYGSAENFAHFVRGRLCDELVERFRILQVPYVYHLLATCPYMGGWVDITWALWKGGAPSSCVISFAIGMSITCTLYSAICIELLYVFCDLFARKRRSCMADGMVSLGIFLSIAVLVLLQTTSSRVAYGAAPFSTPPKASAGATAVDASADALLCGGSIWSSLALLALVVGVAGSLLKIILHFFEYFILEPKKRNKKGSF